MSSAAQKVLNEGLENWISHENTKGDVLCVIPTVCMFYQPQLFLEDLSNLDVGLVLNSSVSGMVFILSKVKETSGNNSPVPREV